MAFWNKLLGGDETGDDIDQMKANLKSGKAVMLDVRGQDERDSVSLKDSIFIPIADIKALDSTAKEVAGLPQDKIIYCH